MTSLGASSLSRLPGDPGQLCSVSQQMEISELSIKNDTQEAQASEHRRGESRVTGPGPGSWGRGAARPGLQAAGLRHDSDAPALLGHLGASPALCLLPRSPSACPGDKQPAVWTGFWNWKLTPYIPLSPALIRPSPSLPGPDMPGHPAPTSQHLGCPPEPWPAPHLPAGWVQPGG